MSDLVYTHTHTLNIIKYPQLESTVYLTYVATKRNKEVYLKTKNKNMTYKEAAL